MLLKSENRKPVRQPRTNRSLAENGQLIGGAMEVSMNTIEDGNHRIDNNLIKHLKSADFFDVEKFPFSTIAITGVESINDGNKKITRDLTMIIPAF